MNTQVSVGAVISRALEIYGKRIGLLLGMAALVLIPAGLLQYLLQQAGGLGSLLGSVVQFAAAALYAGAVVRVVQAENGGSEPGSIGEILGSVSDRIWPLIWVGIVAGIATFFGFLLLIIPGIILLVWWAVFQPVIVVEGVSFDSLGRSRALVKGHGWNVLGIGIVLFLLILVIGGGSLLIGGLIGGGVGAAIVAVALAIFLIPVDGLVRSVLYFALVGQPAGDGVAPPPPPPPAPAA